MGDRTAAEKTSQGLRERTNAEKRQRSQLRRALRLRREDLEDDDEYNEDGAEHESSSNKRARVGDRSGDAANLAAALAPTLNYVGTNLGVPLSLNMAPVVQVPVAKKKVEAKTKLNSLGLNTEGLPPNAVDEDGNILVTDYDILVCTDHSCQVLYVGENHSSNSLCVYPTHATLARTRWPDESPQRYVH